MHAQRALVEASLAGDFDEDVDAFVSERMDGRIRREKGSGVRGMGNGAMRNCNNWAEARDARDHGLDDHFVAAHAGYCDASQQLDVGICTALRTKILQHRNRRTDGWKHAPAEDEADT